MFLFRTFSKKKFKSIYKIILSSLLQKNYLNTTKITKNYKWMIITIVQTTLTMKIQMY